MSWQSYVDDLLRRRVDGKRLTSAAIIGIEDTVRAKSSNFPAISNGEISAIKNGFVRPSTLAASGIYIGGINYNQIINPNPDVLYGKKGRGGFTIKKTNQILIIGIYNEPMLPGECATLVGTFGDYLVENGF